MSVPGTNSKPVPATSARALLAPREFEGVRATVLGNNPGMTEDMATRITEEGIKFVVAAGPKRDIERCQPLFDVMGQRTFVVGEEPTAANVIKLTGNFLITTVIESLAESFAFATKHELEPRVLLDVLTGSLFAAPI